MHKINASENYVRTISVDHKSSKILNAEDRRKAIDYSIQHNVNRRV